ncbi:MAG: cytochrome c oxidase subunit 3 family protein [Candidatus Omnitrophica bacterium]|nr:cytochrome c oxidase subunit 3 family protein [Candidatus Omnitrophota bacterium]
MTHPPLPAGPTVGRLGLESGKLGMWLFLVSEVMFFAGLLSAYIVVRAAHPAWPGSDGHLSVPVGTINTLILICSSMTMALAVGAADRQDARQLRLFLAATITLGLVFLGVKAFEYQAKFHHGIGPHTNIFWSCYFVLTGVHGLHVLIGALANGWVLARTRGDRFWATQRHLVELSGLYWHFVDIVWIFLFPMLYLI